ncbi:MAG: universal stress protein, partial [Pseudomonadota bacterium]
MLAFRKILVPTDLSHCSTRALAEAHEFARQFSATIDLLYVWTMPPLVAPESLLTGMGIDQQP